MQHCQLVFAVSNSNTIVRMEKQTGRETVNLEDRKTEGQKDKKTKRQKD